MNRTTQSKLPAEQAAVALHSRRSARAQHHPEIVCMTKDVSVATADVNDQATKHALFELLEACGEEEANVTGCRDLPPLKTTLDDGEDCGETFLIGYFAGRLAGMLSYRREGPGLRVCRLAISPIFIRHGVASALFNHLMKREPEAPLIRVNTDAANRPAIGCYRRLGFHIERRWATPDGVPMVMLIKA